MRRLSEAIRGLWEENIAGRILLSPWAYRLGRFILGGVFVWAGFSKLLDPKAFAVIISHYGLLPQSLLAPAAVGLPALELIAGVGLIFDVRWSLQIILGLTLLFMGVLWFGILKDLDIDCGCFSTEELQEHEGLRSALYRDILFFGIAMYLFAWRWLHGRLARNGRTERKQGRPTWVFQNRKEVP